MDWFLTEGVERCGADGTVLTPWGARESVLYDGGTYIDFHWLLVSSTWTPPQD
jgi:hypothetical protein